MEAISAHDSLARKHTRSHARSHAGKARPCEPRPAIINHRHHHHHDVIVIIFWLWRVHAQARVHTAVKRPEKL